MDQPPASSGLPEFLDLAGAADLLHTTPRTLRRWTAQGKVPHIRLGRKLLYRREALLQLGMPQPEAKPDTE